MLHKASKAQPRATLLQASQRGQFALTLPKEVAPTLAWGNICPPAVPDAPQFVSQPRPCCLTSLGPNLLSRSFFLLHLGSDRPLASRPSLPEALTEKEGPVPTPATTCGRWHLAWGASACATVLSNCHLQRTTRNKGARISAQAVASTWELEDSLRPCWSSGKSTFL